MLQVRGNFDQLLTIVRDLPNHAPITVVNSVNPHRDAGPVATLAEQVAIERIVAVGKEGTSTAVAALGDMVRVAGNDDAGETGRAASSPISAIMSIKCTVTVIRVTRVM